jgi:regulator of protease activity HflC (stomatin/prohibitin superfamily)
MVSSGPSFQEVPMETASALVFLGAIGCVVLFLSGFFSVNTAEAAIVQRFGRFARTAEAGLNFKIPFAERVVARIDLKVQQVIVALTTKTKDNVFVRIPVAVQYQVLSDRIDDAYYKLDDPRRQIEAFVMNVIVGHVPRMTLDEVFERQAEISTVVAKELSSDMAGFGYRIYKALVTNVEPDEKVKSAMNDINAAQREQEASKARGEAEKILVVKRAEAEAESKTLQGKGIAGQRAAIIDGLRQSFETFQRSVEGATAKDVLMMVLTTQYLDTIKEIGAQGKSNTILLPHSPGGLADIFSQIQQAVAVGGITAHHDGEPAVTHRPTPPPQLPPKA